MDRCIVYTGIRLLLLIHPFISSFFFLSNFQTLKFSSHFSQELWGLEGWNSVHTWIVGGCIVYTAIRQLLLICPFIFHFQTWKFFVTLFSGTVRPRRLKLVTHVENGWIYRVYRKHAAALEGWNLLHTWKMGGFIVYTGSMLLLLFVPLFFHFSFSPIFWHWNFSSHFYQELWGLEVWNLVHTWIVGRCIVYTGNRLLLLICPFIFFIFLSLQFSNTKIFRHTSLRNCEA